MGRRETGDGINTWHTLMRSGNGWGAFCGLCAWCGLFRTYETALLRANRHAAFMHGRKVSALDPPHLGNTRAAQRRIESLLA